MSLRFILGRLWGAVIICAFMPGSVVGLMRDQVNEERRAKGKKPLPWWRGPHEPSVLWMAVNGFPDLGDKERSRGGDAR